MRTLDRTIVSIPNSNISQRSSENFTLRDRFWFHHFLSLRYDTSRSQIERILADVQAILVQAHEVETETARVNFIGLQTASFQVEVFAYLKADTYNIFLNRQQELLLKILAAVSDSGARLAFPSQTTYFGTVDASSLSPNLPL